MNIHVLEAMVICGVIVLGVREAGLEAYIYLKKLLVAICHAF